MATLCHDFAPLPTKPTNKTQRQHVAAVVVAAAAGVVAAAAAATI